MCNKIGYESKSEAATEAKRMLNQSKWRKEARVNKQYPYECNFCDKWHLTSQKTLKKRVQRYGVPRRK